MAVPVLGLRSGEAGVQTLRDRLPSKQGYLALNAAFSGETTDPVEIVIDGNARRARDGRHGRVDRCFRQDGPLASDCLCLRARARLALLTIAFRSLVVAAKAIVVNLPSVGAASGLLVLVFQQGVGNEIFGFPQVDAIESWVPLFLFAVLFGLSMDYHVFLLSRIRERFRHTGDNSAAISHGVGSTGRIITGGALIIVAVSNGFARGELVMFQQMGFGVAVALLLDATLVRLVLVPAAMQLLDARSWYLPGWLRWLSGRARGGGAAYGDSRSLIPQEKPRSRCPCSGRLDELPGSGRTRASAAAPVAIA